MREFRQTHIKIKAICLVLAALVEIPAKESPNAAKALSQKFTNHYLNEFWKDITVFTRRQKPKRSSQFRQKN